MRIADDLLVGKAGPVFSVHLDAGPAINPARFPAFPLLKAPNNARRNVAKRFKSSKRLPMARQRQAGNIEVNHVSPRADSIARKGTKCQSPVLLKISGTGRWA
jgi:hypothetical protein